EKDEAGGDAQGDAEYALGSDPLVVGNRREADTAMRKQSGHPGAGEAVDDKYQGDDCQWRAERSAGSLKQQWNADAGGDQIKGGQIAWSLGQLLIQDEQISCTGSRH